MKFLKNLLLVLVAAFALVGCGKKDPVEPQGDGTTFRDVTVADTSLDSIGAGHKVYVTSIGQKSFSYGASLVCDDAEIETENGDDEDASTLAAADVENGSVVVIVIGWSGKGLTESGVTQASENARADAFKTRAQAGEISLVIVTLDGKDTRGTNTDGLLTKLLPVAKVALMFEDGTTNGFNYDGQISTFANGTPVYFYTDETDMVPSFEFMLK